MLTEERKGELRIIAQSSEWRKFIGTYAEAEFVAANVPPSPVLFARQSLPHPKAHDSPRPEQP